jgi:uncharacterized membrane protein
MFRFKSFWLGILLGVVIVMLTEILRRAAW